VFANAFLAGHCQAHVRQGEILPMALDTNRWRPSPAKSPGLRLGWAGAPGNLPFLRRIEPVLGTILTEFPAAQLQVLCGQDPHLSIPYHWLPWRPDHEIPFVQSLDIGLLPLPHEPFACGKSPIKALQYLACGVLVVGDLPAGGSGADDFLRPGASLAVGRDGSWTDCLRRAVTDVASRAAAASRGRAWAVSKHSLPTVAEQWLAVLDPARRPQKLADCEQENAETLEAKIRPNTTDPEGKT
jgi:glycosyltransferase involved in cell wall biosynthesis